MRIMINMIEGVRAVAAVFDAPAGVARAVAAAFTAPPATPALVLSTAGIFGNVQLADSSSAAAADSSCPGTPDWAVGYLRSSRLHSRANAG